MQPILFRYTWQGSKKGRLVASGPYEDLDRAGAPLRALYLPE